MKKIVSIAVVLLWACLAFAAAGDDISKEANQLIRSAEKEFFAGKADAAMSTLKDAREKLDSLQAAEPSHRTLKSLQSKYDRLLVKVEKKLGGSSKPAAPAAPKAGQIDTSDVLSHGAQSNLKAAHKAMDAAEKELSRATTSLQAGDYNMVKSYIDNTTYRLDGAGGSLDKVVNNNKANPDHPEVSAARSRLDALQVRLSDLKKQAGAASAGAEQATAQAAANNSRLNEEWIPKIRAFITPSPSYLQYPGTYNQQALAKQEQNYAQAVSLLTQIEQAVPAAQQPPELAKAVKDLQFAIGVYDDQKGADGKNRLQPVEMELSQWEQRFEQNKAWNEESDKALFIITSDKMAFQKKQIESLKANFPEEAAAFEKRIGQIEKENGSWMEKKKAWMERPRPFPEAKMINKKLEGEITALLDDRGIEVNDFVIIDKDWWVSHGEYRFMAGAVLSKDKDGKYWSRVTFRQIQTLAGYMPTEIWEIDEIKVRLP